MDMNGWVDDWKSERYKQGMHNFSICHTQTLYIGRIDMSIQVDRPLPFHHLEAIIIDPVVVVTMEGVMKVHAIVVDFPIMWIETILFTVITLVSTPTSSTL
jgi:hypothetical protein